MLALPSRIHIRNIKLLYAYQTIHILCNHSHFVSLQTTTKFGPGSRAFVSPSATPTTPSAPKTKTPTLPAQNYINNTRQAPSTPSGWISEHLPEEYEKRTIASRDAFTSGITLDSYQRRLEDYVRDMPEYIRERVRQIIEEIKSGIPAPKQPLSRTIACT